MKGIAEWLASIGLSEYAQRFADNAIDLSVIRDLTEQDLKSSMGSLLHRPKQRPNRLCVTSPSAVTSR